MQKLNEYLKVAETAKVLGVAENTVRSWADSGVLPMKRNPANGYRLFFRADLEAFLKQLAPGSLKTSSSPGNAKYGGR